MLHKPPKNFDDQGNRIFHKTGPGGNTNPQRPHQLAQGIVETIRSKTAAFRTGKEKFLTPPEDVQKEGDWK